MRATIELIEDALPRGEYKPTMLDEQKAKADILVTAIDSHYEIVVKNPSIKLSGRGVKRSEWIGNVYYITGRVYKMLCNQYNVMCDF